MEGFIALGYVILAGKVAITSYEIYDGYQKKKKNEQDRIKLFQNAIGEVLNFKSPKIKTLSAELTEYDREKIAFVDEELNKKFTRTLLLANDPKSLTEGQLQQYKQLEEERQVIRNKITAVEKNDKDVLVEIKLELNSYITPVVKNFYTKNSKDIDKNSQLYACLFLGLAITPENIKYLAECRSDVATAAYILESAGRLPVNTVTEEQKANNPEIQIMIRAAAYETAENPQDKKEAMKEFLSYIVNNKQLNPTDKSIQDIIENIRKSNNEGKEIEKYCSDPKFSNFVTKLINIINTITFGLIEKISGIDLEAEKGKHKVKSYAEKRIKEKNIAQKIQL